MDGQTAGTDRDDGACSCRQYFRAGQKSIPAGTAILVRRGPVSCLASLPVPVPTRGCDLMLRRLAYLGVTNAFALLRLLPGGDRDKDAEILALRHQIAVLHRQLDGQRVQFDAPDRAWLAALLHRLPRPGGHGAGSRGKARGPTPEVGSGIGARRIRSCR